MDGQSREDDSLPPVLCGVPGQGDPILCALVGFFERARGLKNVEIEAKFGRLVDKHGGRRMSLPISSEGVIVPGYTRFESEMSPSAHQAFGKMFDSLVEAQQLTCTDQMLEDRFYGPSKQRATYLIDKSGETRLVQMCRKERVGDLEIYFPRGLDVRVSINIEHPEDPSTVAGMRHTHFRRKNRRSYGFRSLFKLDLTVVENMAGNRPRPIHELELEWTDTDSLVGGDGQTKTAEFLEIVRRLAQHVGNLQ